MLVFGFSGNRYLRAMRCLMTSTQSKASRGVVVEYRQNDVCAYVFSARAWDDVNQGSTMAHRAHLDIIVSS